MSNVFSPRLDVLPATQQRLWLELSQTPGDFILYGGTAIALRLGHRQSVDFDFFSPRTFEPLSLLEALPYLKGAEVRKSSANNLTVTVLILFGGKSATKFRSDFQYRKETVRDACGRNSFRIACAGKIKR